MRELFQIIAVDHTVIAERVELCYKLAWKLIKAYLEAEGLVCNSPRFSFKAAFQNGLIENELLWLQMIDDRNELTHIYSEVESRDIYDRIRTMYFLLCKHF